MFKKISLKEKMISVFIIITLFQGILIALVTWAPYEEIKSMDEHPQQKALSSISNNMPEVQLAVLSNAQGKQIARWDLKPCHF